MESKQVFPQVITPLQAVRIDTSEWFDRPDFMAWLNDATPGHPATWHTPGQPAGGLSDVFVVFDHGEGSDDQSIPEDIWAKICTVCDLYKVEYGIVWIVNSDHAKPKTQGNEQ